MQAHSASISTSNGVSTLNVKNGFGATIDSFTISGALAGNDFTVSPDSPGNAEGGTDLTLEPIPYRWSTVVFPAQPTTGEHFYPVYVANNGGNVLPILYGDTPSDFSAAGPDAINYDLSTLDPFLLPYQSSSQAVETSTFADLPHNYEQMVLVSPTNTGSEGISFVISEDASGTATINRFTVDFGTTGFAAPSSISSLTPVETGLIGSDLFVTSSFSNGPTGFFTGTGASYELGWSQYNSATPDLYGRFPDFQPGRQRGIAGRAASRCRQRGDLRGGAGLVLQQ